MKGDGETHPELSPTDEFAAFERWDVGNLDLSPGQDPRNAARRVRPLGARARPAARCGAGRQPVQVWHGRRRRHPRRPVEPGQRQLLRQVHHLRAVAAPDLSVDGSLHMAQQNKDLGLGIASWQYITSGLTAVWATENTRGALFDALERREVYATTGPRIRLRFFGGWDFSPDDAMRRDLAQIGYTRGVPMGADLLPAPEGATAPTFLAYALRDPMGANLDRLQIVKGWLDAGGNPQEQRLRRRLVRRPPARRRRQAAAGRRHRRSLDPVVDQQHRSVRARRRLAGSRLRPRSARLLLRPRHRDPDAALDRL